MKNLTRLGITSWLLVILFLGSAFTNFQTFLGPVYAEETRAPSILYVGENATYQKIQDAINASQPGDTVFVYNGLYYENLTISKSINLLGEDPNLTLLGGSNAFGSAVNITTDGVNISNLTIAYMGPDPEGSGLSLINVQNCNVSNNILSSGGSQALLIHQSKNNSIINNLIWESLIGLKLEYSGFNTFIENQINFNVGDFIFFSGGIHLKNSTNNVFILNNISNNLYGFNFINSHNNSLIQNNFTNNTYICGSLYNSNFTRFINNNFSGDERGLFIENSHWNNLTNNRFHSLSMNTGIYFSGTKFNNLKNNIFRGGEFSIGGNLIEHWNTHEIDIDNTYNDKPIYYFKNLNNRIISPETGSFILANCSNMEISNINASKNRGSWIKAGFSSNITIKNNTFKGLFLSVHYSNNFTIKNNVFSDNIRSYSTFVLYSTNNNTIENNTIENFCYGITIRHSNYNFIKNNKILNTSFGIEIDFSNYNTITNNTIVDCYKSFTIRDSLHNIIDNNLITNSSSYGISLINVSYSMISNNTLSYNRNGITLDGSSNNSIIYNTIAYNEAYGIRLTSLTRPWDSEKKFARPSNDNSIYYNNFINNYHGWIFQASDECSNHWDNGYPSGGNFRSTYFESDKYSGINQDQPGSDNIGDIPFKIYSDNEVFDNYPLMAPRNLGTKLVPTVPNAPQRFRAKGRIGYVELTWNRPVYDGGSEIIRYNIYRYEGRNQSNLKIYHVPGNHSSFKDSDVIYNKRYEYKIAAENEFGLSLNSSEGTARPRKDEQDSAQGSFDILMRNMLWLCVPIFIITLIIILKLLMSIHSLKKKIK